MLPESGFQIFSLERVQQRFIKQGLLDRFLACMKPASMHCALLVRALFFGLRATLSQSVSRFPGLRLLGSQQR